jgi:hypothetical protein
MKSEILIKKALCVALIAIVSVFCTFTAFAVDYDGDGIDDDESQVETVEAYEPETEPQYEPETEAPTEYVEPQTEEPTEFVEPETSSVKATEYYEPETEQQQTQAAYVEPENEQTTTEFQAPTLAKTVSEKTYSTNYTAGVVSWICVAVGVLTVFVVLVSTKASAHKAKQRAAADSYYNGRR